MMVVYPASTSLRHQCPSLLEAETMLTETVLNSGLPRESAAQPALLDPHASQLARLTGPRTLNSCTGGFGMVVPWQDRRVAAWRQSVAVRSNRIYLQKALVSRRSCRSSTSQHFYTADRTKTARRPRLDSTTPRFLEHCKSCSRRTPRWLLTNTTTLRLQPRPPRRLSRARSLRLPCANR